MEQLKLLTHDELHELHQWFDKQNLPESLQLDKATYIPKLRDTIKRLVAQSEINCDNPKMQGCIILLQRLKEKLESLSVA